MDGSSRGDGIYARRHNLGSIKSIPYASVLICRFFLYSLSYYDFPFNSPYFQVDSVLKLVSRSLVSLRRFFKRPSRGKDLGEVGKSKHHPLVL